jgi:hypothetical protein
MRSPASAERPLLPAAHPFLPVLLPNAAVPSSEARMKCKQRARLLGSRKLKEMEGRIGSLKAQIGRLTVMNTHLQASPHAVHARLS